MAQFHGLRKALPWAWINALSRSTESPSSFADWQRIATCDLCGSVDFEVVADSDRDGKPLRTVLCEGCGFVFTNPRPTAQQIEEFYRREYRVAYKGAWAPKPQHLWRSALVAAERCSRLRPFLREGSRHLDLGSGGGELLWMLRRLGVDARGIEPNEGYGRFAAESLLLPVEVMTFQDLRLEPQSLDSASLFHVAEHLEHPLQALRLLAEALKPGGWLMVEVPHAEATCVFPASRWHLAHLVHFNGPALEHACRSVGLEPQPAWLSPDGGNVAVLARRPAQGDLPALQRQPLPGNAAKVRQTLEGHSVLAHLLTRHPYVRPVERLLRRLREREQLAKTCEPMALLEAAFATLERLV